MKSSIILPSNYEKIFMIEARKSGLIKHIEIDYISDYKYIDQYDEQMLNKCYKMKRNLFQMILLYDEIIIQSFDPSYEYESIKNAGNFKIYSFDDFYYYDASNQENNSLYAEYLKPAILKYLKKEIKSYFEFRSNGKVSYNRMISEIYDFLFKISNDMSIETMKLLELNEIAYKLKNIKNINRMRALNAPITLTDQMFWTEIVNWFVSIYDQLCWQLKISSEQEAYIVNSEFELSKIGCDVYEENINTYMEAYKILKCEYANIIGTLPHMESIEEALSLKEKRKNDIKNLREVICNLEDVLKTEGKEKATIKAINDIKKASTALSKGEIVNKIGKWTTLFSVPVGVIEMVLSGGLIGLGISAVGTATCVIDEIIKRNNSWCEILR